MIDINVNDSYNNSRRDSVLSQVGQHLNPKDLLDECASGWQATKKPERLTGRMCQWLADNKKISR